MTSEQSKFAEENIRLMYRYFNMHDITNEDDRADLFEYYCKIVECYDDKKGKFSTLLYFSLDRYRKHIYNYKYNKCRFSDKPSLSLDSTYDDENDWLQELVCEKDIDIELVEFLDICERVYDKLATKKNSYNRKLEDREIFTMLLAGYTRKEIGNMCNISQQALSVRINKIKAIFYKEMEEC